MTTGSTVPPERPASWPHPDDPLLLAARALDAVSEERGIEATTEDLGINMLALVHVANQRALRVILRRDPIRYQVFLSAMKANNHSLAFQFTDEEEDEIKRLAALYMDALAVGWKAHQLHLEDQDG